MKRSVLSVSLRAVLLLVTLVAVGLAVGKQVYYQRYARNRLGHQYFESLGVRAVVGDPCPRDFVYYVDGTRRNLGLTLTDTPDFIDRLAGRRFSYPAVRELTFRGSFQSDQREFNLEMANNLPRLTPYLESIELPNGGTRAKSVDLNVVNVTVAHLSKLKEIRHVSFLNWPITDEHIESLMTIPHLQVLQVYSPDLTEWHQLKPQLLA